MQLALPHDVSSFGRLEKTLRSVDESSNGADVKCNHISSTIESFTTILEPSTELPTTKTEAITLTTTEAAETTTAAVTPCIDNKFNPPPEGLICGGEGVVMGGPDAHIGSGRSESELTCTEDCKKRPRLQILLHPGGC
ncbi:hypothetical protein FCULG_00000206 [Fusarium culmorum]|uniref:Uncharacterized protein n=1 Tax=Fusarium culmorum TaxID=5516 RepID=A0A2T4GR92_FUSCU|nr:hypothetical protein FCULG_00000206 [Fusarium culmorum]